MFTYKQNITCWTSRIWFRKYTQVKKISAKQKYVIGIVDSFLLKKKTVQEIYNRVFFKNEIPITDREVSNDGDLL